MVCAELPAAQCPQHWREGMLCGGKIPVFTLLEHCDAHTEDVPTDKGTKHGYCNSLHHHLPSPTGSTQAHCSHTLPPSRG